MDRKSFKRFSEITFVRSRDGRLFCPNCRNHFEEEKLRDAYKSLKYCSECAGWSGVKHVMEKRQKERMDVFDQMGMFDPKK